MTPNRKIIIRQRSFTLLHCAADLTVVYRPVFVLLLLLGHLSLLAQQTETTTLEQQLEGLTEVSEDASTEDDSYQLVLQEYLAHPLDLNTVGEEQLNELRIITPQQAHNFLQYRTLLGPFISIYELQAVPGWDAETIAKTYRYFKVGTEKESAASLLRRFRGGEHSLLLRTGRTGPKSNEYKTDSTGVSDYAGSPQRLLFRYSYRYKNELQYGVTGEKDAGEQFFRSSQRQGFDFYSAHIFMRSNGFVKTVALGDFTVNLGQGLVQWQSLAFKKSGAVLQIKRQSAVLRPYQSAGEYNFYRGAGITVGRRKWQGTIFAAFRNTDATVRLDTLNGGDAYITSFQTAGLHRTRSELAARRSQGQLTLGGNISWRLGNFKGGFNMVHHQFKMPVIKDASPYNLYALRGRELTNYSAAYSYTYKNLHLFGELAMSGNKASAQVNGFLLSPASNVDISLLHRRISKHYQSLHANAFTENTNPVNESGWYAGISIRPVYQWQVDAYADLYRFPWLRYRADAPGGGRDYMIQATYKPGKMLEIYSRYRAETKGLNDAGTGAVLAPVVTRLRQNWRTHINWHFTRDALLRCRAEWVWYDKRGNTAEEGFLLYGDIVYSPLLKPYNITCRLQYFETGGYNSRLYAYENDVLYSYTIPAFYGKGTRLYFVVRHRLTSRLTCWIRAAYTKYDDNGLINRLLYTSRHSYSSEYKAQIIYKF